VAQANECYNLENRAYGGAAEFEVVENDAMGIRSFERIGVL
jgi:hypothetical protein